MSLSRMEWFLIITFYLIVANIVTIMILTGVQSTTPTQNYTYDLDDTTGKTSLKSNAQIFFNLMTFSSDIDLGSSVVFFILITFPTIVWIILLATMLIPTINAGS